jgi:hypothetical protein
MSSEWSRCGDGGGLAQETTGQPKNCGKKVTATVPQCGIAISGLEL